MTEKDYTVIRALNGGIGLPERLAGYDGFAAPNERHDFAEGLVSLGFIKAAIRRRARFWFALAVIGVVAGGGYYASSPASYKATTSLLLTPGPYENINTAASNDQAMAESRTVAGLAVKQLGLQEGAASFLATYTAAPITERVIIITVNAPSSAQAVQRASAVAAAFLKFRATEMQSEQQLVLASLNQQASEAQQRLNSLSTQINNLTGQGSSATQESELKSLRAQRTQVTGTLTNLQEAAIGNQTVTKPATEAAVNGSVVLDPATPLVHSRLKPLVLDVGIGFIGGLTLGMAIVVIQALVSDRLRRRDNVAQALGAPVRLSTGPIRLSRWLPQRGRGLGRWGLGRGGSVTRDAGVLRIAAHLGRVVPGSSSGVASLAVVPVDDLRVPALALMSLAVSCAKDGRKVVVADLCDGAPAARLVGARHPGTGTVTAYGTSLVIAVPDHDDVAPAGPLGSVLAAARRSAFADEVAAACDSAGLLFTLTTLDPALGGDHLVTWSGDAVVMVTAGQSSWTKIRGVSEMIRLSGTRLISAVLTGADKTDESLGAIVTPETV